MPSSHLACDGSTEPVSCSYPPFCAASARPPCGGRRRLWEFRTDSRVPWPLRFGLARSFTNLKKNRKPVARRHVVGGIAQSPHGHRSKADPRTGSVRFRAEDAETAWFPYNLRTVSVRIYHGLPPRPRRRNRTMPVDNVNTYSVARIATYDAQKIARKIVDKFIARRPGQMWPGGGGGALDFQLVGVCRWGVENRTLS